MLPHSLGLSYNYNHNSSSTQVHTTREDILGHNFKIEVLEIVEFTKKTLHFYKKYKNERHV
jgi:hypothetical protein